MAQGIKGLIFDKDGTLFDFRATWDSWGARLIRDVGQTEAERGQLADVLGYDSATQTFRPDSLVIAGTPGEIIAAIRRLRPADNPDALLDKILASSSAIPQIEATPLAPLLDGFRASGLHIGLATNDSESAARAHLTSAGIADRFDYIAGYDSGHGAKPGPGMLNGFLTATGLTPPQTAMVGDSTHDLMAGRAAKMTTIGVLTGTASAAVLAPLADVVLRSIAELPGWLAGSEPGVQ